MKCFLHYWTHVRGIHQSRVVSLHKGPENHTSDISFVGSLNNCWCSSSLDIKVISSHDELVPAIHKEVLNYHLSVKKIWKMKMCSCEIFLTEAHWRKLPSWMGMQNFSLAMHLDLQIDALLLFIEGFRPHQNPTSHWLSWKAHNLKAQCIIFLLT